MLLFFRKEFVGGKMLIEEKAPVQKENGELQKFVKELLPKHKSKKDSEGNVVSEVPLDFEDEDFVLSKYPGFFEKK